MLVWEADELTALTGDCDDGLRVDERQRAVGGLEVNPGALRAQLGLERLVRKQLAEESEDSWRRSSSMALHRSFTHRSVLQRAELREERLCLLQRPRGRNIENVNGAQLRN